MNVLNNLKYTKEHEWLKIEGDFAYIGITDHAQSQLGDIVFIEVNTVGETLSKGEAFGSIDAVKATSEVYMPVGGEIINFNPVIEQAADTINKEPYGDGWIVKIKMTNSSEVSELLDADAYKALIA